jgi:hypothetical protein
MVLKHKKKRYENGTAYFYKMNDWILKHLIFSLELEAAQINLIQDNCPDNFLHIKTFM